MRDWIETYTGKRIWIPPEDSNVYSVVDIAHSLANQCRYNGHCEFHYSVAQHSMLVADCVPENLKAFALLHDASESYCSDIPKPLKHQLKYYLKIEKAIQSDIYKQLLKRCPDKEEKAEIKHADTAVLLAEAAVIVRSGGVGWKHPEGMKPADVEIKRELPDKIEKDFKRAIRSAVKNHMDNFV